MTAQLNSRHRNRCVAMTYFAASIMLAGAIGNAHAIDCKSAAALNAAEKMICQNDALLIRDAEMNTLFQRLMKATSAMPEMMRKRQRSWLGERDACAEVACIERLYEQRIRYLQLIEGRFQPLSSASISSKQIAPKFGLTGVMLVRGEWQIKEFVLRGEKSMDKPVALGLGEHIWQSDLGQPLPPLNSNINFIFDIEGARICAFLEGNKKEDCAILGSTRILIGNRIAYDEMKKIVTLPRSYAADFRTMPASEVGTFFVNRQPWFSAVPVHDRTLYVPARACETANPKRCIEGYQVWRAISADAVVVGLP